MGSRYRADICVIIPTWNKRDLLRSCLLSLASQTVQGSVLVVDNGSSDGTAEMMREQFPTLGYLRLDRNLGFAAAVNQGIRHSTASAIALLNNDTEADRHWLQAGVEALRRYPEYSFFASRQINFWRRDRIDSAGDCYSRTGLAYKRGAGRDACEYEATEPVLSASAAAAFFRRMLFERVGLLDETFYMYLEDVDLGLRAQAAGFGCLYLPEAVVYHMEAASDPQCQSVSQLNTTGSSRAYYSPTRVYWITRNRWQLMVTYQPPRHAPWLLYGWARSLLFHALKAGHTWSFLRGLAAGIASSPHALRKRRRVLQTSQQSLEELWRLIARS